MTNGGFCGIFRTVACIGDSLSSGEFEGFINGHPAWYDCYEYSWGQYMARDTGTKVYNFSKGVMTAREYCETFAKESGYWNKELARVGNKMKKENHIMCGTENYYIS